MADDSDSDSERRNRVENQPYDETLEVPDAEDVPSVYSPLPKNPKNSATNQPPSRSNTLRPNDTNRATQQSFKEDPRVRQAQQVQQQQQNMSDNSQSSETPKITNRLRGDTNPNNLSLKNRLNSKPRADDQPMPSRGRGTSAGDMNAANRSMNMNRGSNNSGGSGSGSGGRNRQQPIDRENNDTGESESEGNDSGEDSQQEQLNELQGGYDPTAFRDLPVSQDIKDIFKYIERYQPQSIELDFKLKPFIPEYIPCIGDIDAFIKIPRPDGKPDIFGLNVVDEPSSKQSDPHVLDLQLRSLSKQSTVAKPTVVKSLDNPTPKAIDSWIKNISDLQKNKPVQTVNYQRAMPDIEQLMQAWPPEFEELIKEVSLPSGELNVDLSTYTDIICALLDIPVYKSKVQSLHVLFTLYSEFKNSEHFNNEADKNDANNPFLTNKKPSADQLIIE